jgi:hypothetical protein
MTINTELTTGFERDDHDGGVDAQAILSAAEHDRDAAISPTVDGEPDYSKPYVPWRERPKRRRIDPYAAGRLTTREPWQAVETPEPVAASWSEVEARAADLQAATEQLQLLASEQKAEAAASSRAIVKATEEGKPPPKIRQTDWATQRLVRETKYGLALDNAGSARKAYNAAVQAALPAWRAAVAATVAERRSEAQSAFAEAAAKVRQWRLACDAGAALDRACNRDPYGPRTVRAEQEVLTAGVRGLGATERMLASNDAVVSGSWLVDTEQLDPPRWVRAAMVESESGFMALGRIEADERYEFTDFTKDSASVFGGSPLSPADMRARVAQRHDVVIL